MLIRKGEKKDLPQVLALITELAIYEKAPQEVSNTLEMMERDGFGANPVYGLWVAAHESSIVGIAIYYVRYSTWKGPVLYLEDIVVTESERGKGIGAKLFNEVMETAVQAKYAHMSWQVLDWNQPALNFYSKYKASMDAEWLNGKLTLEQMQTLIANDKG